MSLAVAGHIAGDVPLIVTNQCRETIWPGLLTVGDRRGPGTGGFELRPNQTRKMEIPPNWLGRIWGRTNCTFNADGTGANDGWACTTGDCNRQLSCSVSGEKPATLAELNLNAGSDFNQDFYDVSLVDGYNLPMGLVYHPSPQTAHIPPSLTNIACIATAGHLMKPARSGTIYSNSTYPIPWEKSMTNDNIARWCPFDLQAFPPTKPGDGVYPYPDDNIQRPTFDPCRSTCDFYGRPEDCCSGSYNSPDVCRAGLYSQNAKSVCPDAYSFAYDDRESTFVIPSGGGWEVVFCPKGRSTDILRTYGAELSAVGQNAIITQQMLNLKMAAIPERSPRAKSFIPGQMTIPGENLKRKARLMRRATSSGTRSVSCKQVLGAGLFVVLGMAWI